MFVDRTRVVVRGGDGGAGVASFQRRKGLPRGKPNGGSGGDGGDVYLEADERVATLLPLDRKPHHQADSGGHGEGELRHGPSGKPHVVGVPLGTLVRDEQGMVIADLVAPGQRVLVARGGRGGMGNAAFVSKARKAPTYSEQGEFGEERVLLLELKLIADAALVGFPNAGKSTLISAVSAARPKIADYPFTTLQPHLGVVTIDDRIFVLADIPGLIEGAAEGKGLGHEFLRHTERARVIVYLLDPSPLQSVAVADQLETLRRELAAYSEDLASRPAVVAVSKTDIVEAPPLPDGAFAISAVTGEGIPVLLHAIADRVALARQEAPPRPGYQLHQPLTAPFTVSRMGTTWVVAGRDVERAIGLDDLTVGEAADVVAERLRRLGVDEALAAAGAEQGDEVRIGSVVFEFRT
jgi:GTP-binding protein